MKVHLIADVSLGGIKREYIEVERKAVIGEYYIKDGKEFVLTERDVNYTSYLGEGLPNALNPTDIIHHEGSRYKLVKRKAEVGEKVIDLVDGEVLIITGINSNDRRMYGESTPIWEYEYRVIEPVVDEKPPYKLNELLAQITPENKHEEWPPLTEESIELTANDIRWQPDKVIDLLANLARRVSSLESKLGSVEAQLKDTQGNVERQGVEIAEIKRLTESNEEDIRELDERSQVVNVIQKYYGGAR